MGFKFWISIEMFLKNYVIHTEEEARGNDHKCLLVDSKSRRKFWLFSLLVDLAHSVDFTSRGDPLPLASVRCKHSQKRIGCFPGSYEGPLPLIYCLSLPENFN